MPTVMLTAKSVPSLPAGDGGKRIDYWDGTTPGLVLRVTGRARAYSVWYRVNGVPRRFTLGPADEVDLADAREQALEIRRQSRSGVDAAVASVLTRTPRLGAVFLGVG